jgi:hypothetical protein
VHAARSVPDFTLTTAASTRRPRSVPATSR